LGTDVAALLGCLVAILLSCVLFTNGIEWTGRKLRLGEGAVGSILAAVGTALPETMIPVIAFFGPALSTGARAERQGVGLGAIFGSPFMLATLALLVVGLTAIIGARRGRRAREVRPDARTVGRDMRYFLVIYGLAVAVGIVHVFLDRSAVPAGYRRVYDVLKIFVAVGLMLAYVLYVRAAIRAGRRDARDAEERSPDGRRRGEEPGPLYLQRLLAPASAPSSLPPMWLCLLQTLAGLAGIAVAAHFFVEEVVAVSSRLGVPTVILALVIAPFATELPEMTNSLIWIRRGKDTLAVGNITGAMVFQASVPVTIGMLATSWKIDRAAIVSALIALASVGLHLVWLRRRGRLSPWWLLVSGALYLVFLAYLLIMGEAAIPTGGQ